MSSLQRCVGTIVLTEEDKRLVEQIFERNILRILNEVRPHKDEIRQACKEDKRVGENKWRDTYEGVRVLQDLAYALDLSEEVQDRWDDIDLHCCEGCKGCDV